MSTTLYIIQIFRQFFINFHSIKININNKIDNNLTSTINTQETDIQIWLSIMYNIPVYKLYTISF